MNKPPILDAIKALIFLLVLFGIVAVMSDCAGDGSELGHGLKNEYRRAK
jgi:hypothetical protein